MEKYINSINLIDLVSEKHKKMRNLLHQKYLENGIVKLNDMEYYLISILGKDKLSISESARIMNISRQAVHKFSKELLELELITVEHSETNKRNKYLFLTKKGKELYKKTELIKDKIEEEISQSLGKDNVNFLNKLFKKNWI